MIRRLHAVTAALVLTAAGSLTIASPAEAEPLPITEGFEGTPSARWTTFTVPTITSVFLGNNPDIQPRSGTNVAMLTSYPDAPAQASIFRTITPDTTPSSVQVQVWVRRFAYQNENDESVQVQFRVRQGGRTGRIISNMGRAVREVRVVRGTALWEVHNFHPARPAGTFTVEISAYLGTVIIDDLTITTT
ncbi:hypothetical protein [Paractinoplanes rishiriensis]|uniref:Secreted protein n=1 Tax=Paractinoplanes rishiriensis TaxID=1050105 RepID=A0A919K1J2_9ACTN|nr:hypothetical protein [Actinoplanes rishiriensis]GIE97724.1 hypothetical protein Ari01nite_51890 [Actinoplanes rishiriensis]